MFTNSNPSSLKTASGNVAYRMTNDYLFHIVLEQDNFALTGLIASLLHIPVDEIRSVTPQNPILRGSVITGKEFILDLLVVFNDDTYINLEMQAVDRKNWVPRSLSYLCREFDSLEHGEDYNNVRSVFHIGFLDYELFPEHPEFYASYRMRNLKDGHVYSDKFTLAVVSLNQIHIATDEDKHYDIDKWAAFFKATTWEEIKMIAQENKYLQSAAESMYSSVTDPKILALCRKRDEDIRGEQSRLKTIESQKKQIAEQADQIQNQADQIQNQADQIQNQADQIQNQADIIADLRRKLSENGINADYE